MPDTYQLQGPDGKTYTLQWSGAQPPTDDDFRQFVSGIGNTSAPGTGIPAAIAHQPTGLPSVRVRLNDPNNPQNPNPMQEFDPASQAFQAGAAGTYRIPQPPKVAPAIPTLKASPGEHPGPSLGWNDLVNRINSYQQGTSQGVDLSPQATQDLQNLRHLASLKLQAISPQIASYEQGQSGGLEYSSPEVAHYQALRQAAAALHGVLQPKQVALQAQPQSDDPTGAALHSAIFGDAETASGALAAGIKQALPTGMLNAKADEVLRTSPDQGVRIFYQTIKNLDPTQIPAFVNQITQKGGFSQAKGSIETLARKMVQGDQEAGEQLAGMFTALVAGAALHGGPGLGDLGAGKAFGITEIPQDHVAPTTNLMDPRGVVDDITRRKIAKDLVEQHDWIEPDQAVSVVQRAQATLKKYGLPITDGTVRGAVNSFIDTLNPRKGIGSTESAATYHEAPQDPIYGGDKSVVRADAQAAEAAPQPVTPESPADLSKLSDAQLEAMLRDHHQDVSDAQASIDYLTRRSGTAPGPTLQLNLHQQRLNLQQAQENAQNVAAEIASRQAGQTSTPPPVTPVANPEPATSPAVAATIAQEAAANATPETVPTPVPQPTSKPIATTPEASTAPTPTAPVTRDQLLDAQAMARNAILAASESLGNHDVNLLGPNVVSRILQHVSDQTGVPVSGLDVARANAKTVQMSGFQERMGRLVAEGKPVFDNAMATTLTPESHAPSAVPNSGLDTSAQPKRPQNPPPLSNTETAPNPNGLATKEPVSHSEGTPPASHVETSASDLGSMSPSDFAALFDEVAADHSEPHASEVQAKSPTSPANRNPEKPRQAPKRPSTPAKAKSKLERFAESQGIHGVGEELNQLAQMFGASDHLREESAPYHDAPVTGVDPKKYEVAKPLFESTLRKVISEGKTARDFVALIIQALSPTIRPYLMRFQHELSTGKIDLNSPQKENVADNRSSNAEGTTTEPVRNPGEKAPTGEPAADVRQADGSGHPERNAQQDVEASGRHDDDNAPSGSDVRPGVRGSESASVPAGGGSGDESRPGKPDKGRSPKLGTNYRVTESEDMGDTGVAQKKRDLVAAIQTLKKIEAEGDRPATKDEQAALAKFPGWGWTGNMLNQKTSPDPAFAAAVKSLLTPKEWESAVEGAVLNSHFTSGDVINALWSAVHHLGFRAGSALESSAGKGLFLGMAPQKMKIDWTAVELDSLTGRILKKLYPESDVRISGFEQAGVAPESQDLAIGNIPFGGYGVHDSAIEKQWGKGITERIHNYFFVKSLEALKPGGVLAYVTSKGTLDANDPAAVLTRETIAKMADFVGAIRLPNNAFGKNAGTEVTTDIIFLRKRFEGEPPGGQDFLTTQPVKTKEGANMLVNQYFVQHPDMVLGQHSNQGKMYGRQDGTQYTLEGKFTDKDYERIMGEPWVQGKYRTNEDMLRAMLAKAISRLPKNVFGAAKSDKPVSINPTPPENVRVGAMFPQSDKWFIRTGPVTSEPATLSSREVAIMKSYMPLRTALLNLLDAQSTLSDDAALKPLQATLKKTYDAFVKANGILNEPATAKFIQRDPDGYTVLSLERGTTLKKVFTKTGLADVFTQRVIKYGGNVETATNPHDALIGSLINRGKVDMAEMQRLTGMPESDIAEALKGQIFQDPSSGEWLPADEYGSGNVRIKLAQAESAAEKNPVYKDHVEFLKTKQPADVSIEQIEAPLNASWLPAETLTDFARQLFGSRSVKVTRVPVLNDFMLHNGPSYHALDTSRLRASDIFANLLANRPMTVYDTLENGSRVLNEDATTAARQRADDIVERWETWFRSNENAVQQMEHAYNHIVNAFALRRFDGGFLTLPGSTMTMGGKSFALHSHQKNAIWRTMQRDAVLYAHGVGSGKTLTIVGSSMELKRTGMRNKSLVACLNGTEGQFQSAYRSMYPNSNVLVLDAKSLTKERRKATLAQIATGGFDAIVMPHSVFYKIPVSPELQDNYFNEKINELREAIQEVGGKMSDADAEKSRDPSIKQMARALKGLKKRLEKIRESAEKRQDAGPFWEHLGIDQIFVDEAHEYKNLGYASSQPGLGSTGSQRAADLDMKIQHVRSNGGGVAFASGTPIANSVAEMYAIFKYLVPDQLEQMGIKTFDQWASVYGKVLERIERNPAGQYKPKSRLAKFHNLPELVKMFQDTADVVQTRDMVKRGEITLPALLDENGEKTGKAIVVESKPTDAQRSFFLHLSVRAKRIEQRKGPPSKGDDIILSVSTDGRKASIDIRLVDSAAADEPNSKINQAVRNIVQVYKDPQIAAQKGTQVVFLDLGTPKETKPVLKDLIFKGLSDDDARDAAIAKLDEANYEPVIQQNDDGTYDVTADITPTFNLYDDIKRKLIKAGVPEKEIAFMHDAKNKEEKTALMDRVNEGDIRVILTSTAKGGVGVNIQKRLFAAHHIDPTWRPCDIEQRDGRIIRQGNIWPGIQMYRYVNVNTYDAFMWDKLEAKQTFIQQIMNGSLEAREAEDLSGDSSFDPAVINAIAQGNPEILEYLQMVSDIKRLESGRRSYSNEQSKLARDKESFIRRHAESEKELAQLRKVEAYASGSIPEKFAITLRGEEFDDRKKAGAILLHEAREAAKQGNEPTKIGSYGGFDIYTGGAEVKDSRGQLSTDGKYSMWLRSKDRIGDSYWESPQREIENAIGAEGDAIAGYAVPTINRIHTLAQYSTEQADRTLGESEFLQKKIDEANAEIGKPWRGQAAYDKMKERFTELDGTIGQQLRSGDVGKWGGEDEFNDKWGTSHWDRVLASAKAARDGGMVREPSSDYNGEGELDFGGTDPWPVRPGTTQRQIDTSLAAIGRLGRFGAVRASAITRELRGRGYDLIGREVHSAQDLAVAAQILRDPGFETMRYFYTKGGSIVGYSGITARYAGGANVFLKGHDDTWIQELRDEMAARGADGLYLLHNHPSGDASPSHADYSATERIARNFPEFKAHVIIDSNEYGVIRSDATQEVIKYDFHKNDALLTPSVPHPLLDAVLGNAEDLATVGKNLTTKHGWLTVIGRTSRGGKGYLRSIVDVPASQFENDSTIGQLRSAVVLRKIAREQGVPELIAIMDTEDMSRVLNDSKLTALVKRALESGLFLDVLDQNGRSLRNDIPYNRLWNIELGGPLHGRPAVNETPAENGLPQGIQELHSGADLGRAFEAILNTGPDGEKIHVNLGKRIRNLFVENLSNLRQVDHASATMAMRVAQSRAEAGLLIRRAMPMLAEAAGDPTYPTLFRTIAVESRLIGARDRLEGMAADVRHMDDATLTEQYPDVYSDVADRLGIGRDIEGLMMGGDMDGARTMLSDALDGAASNVASVMPRDEFDANIATPQFAAARRVYREHFERPLAENHASNEGVFSTALGPANIYYPLIPLDEHGNPIKASNASKGIAFSKPKNKHNAFAMGSAADYDTSLEGLGTTLGIAIRGNNRAALVTHLEDHRILRKVTPKQKAAFGEHPSMDVNGTLFAATYVPIKAGKLIVTKDGKAIFQPGQEAMVPIWLAQELDPVLNGNYTLDSRIGSNLISKLETYGMAGPLDALLHTHNIVGALVSGTPYLSKGLFDRTIGNAPVIKRLNAVLKIAMVNPMDERALADLHEIAKLGQLPNRYASETISRHFAENSGAHLATIGGQAWGKSLPQWMQNLPISFAPIIYGPQGVDVRGRLIMYRVSRELAGPKATPADIGAFMGQLGTYNRAAESQMERALKDIRVGTFATAGKVKYLNAIRTWLMRSKIPDQGASAATRLSNRLQQQISGGAIGFVATWILAYYAATGKWPWDDALAEFGKIPVPAGVRNSELGQMVFGKGNTQAYISMGFAYQSAEEGARALGIRGYWNEKHLGGTDGQAFDRAAVDMFNTGVHPYISGRTFTGAFTAATGSEPYVTSTRDSQGKRAIQLYNVSPEKGGGAAQLWENAKQGAARVNSTLGNIATSLGMLDEPYYKVKGDEHLSIAEKTVDGVLNIAFPQLIKEDAGPAKMENRIAKEAAAIRKQTDAQTNGGMPPSKNALKALLEGSPSKDANPFAGVGGKGAGGSGLGF